MKKKQFKAESKKLLDMMINSIYTHKEIFLRELISNASDAIDKLYFRSLTDDSVKMNRDEFCIMLDIDKEARTLTISDNGIGMTAEELESNLGTIAKSGSFNFKNENADNENADDISVIGQFGVGFYSSFMVADKVTIDTLSFQDGAAPVHWECDGGTEFSMEEGDREERGTEITLYLNEDSYEFSNEYRAREVLEKYCSFMPVEIYFTNADAEEPEKEEIPDVVDVDTADDNEEKTDAETTAS